MSPASGADLAVRNVLAAPVVFSVCGAPQQACHEVLALALTQTSVQTDSVVPSS